MPNYHFDVMRQCTPFFLEFLADHLKNVSQFRPGLIRDLPPGMATVDSGYMGDKGPIVIGPTDYRVLL